MMSADCNEKPGHDPNDMFCEVCGYETEHLISFDGPSFFPGFTCCNDWGDCEECGKLQHSPEAHLFRMFRDPDRTEDAWVCESCRSGLFNLEGFPHE
jgi:hypothetical protein